MKVTRRKDAGGFTLLELLMVVIIIAILASIALPQFLKAAERAKMAEALTMLGSLRSAEVRYFAQWDEYSGGVTGSSCNLDVCSDDVSGTQVFKYAATATGTTFDISAERLGSPPAPCVSAYKVHIFQDGVISGSDCLSAL